MLDDRECAVCGGLFTPGKANAKYCSAECRDNPQYKYAQYRKAQDRGGRVCRHCGKKFKGPNYFYCGSCHYNISRSVEHG